MQFLWTLWIYQIMLWCTFFGSGRWSSLAIVFLTLVEWNSLSYTLQWRHSERDGVSNHQSHDSLLKCLFRRRSNKTSKLRVTGLLGGIHRWPVNSPYKEPVTRKRFPFDDVIIIYLLSQCGFYLTFPVVKHNNNLLWCYSIKLNCAQMWFLHHLQFFFKH